MLIKAALSVYNAAKRPLAQFTLRRGEVREDVEHVQPYGFASSPKPGAEALIVEAFTRGIAIVIDDRRYRLVPLAPGEVALFDDLGQVVHLKRAGIEVISPSKITLAAPNIELNATTKIKLTSPTVEVDAATKIKLDSAAIDTTGVLKNNSKVVGSGIIVTGVVAGGDVSSGVQ